MQLYSKTFFKNFLLPRNCIPIFPPHNSLSNSHRDAILKLSKSSNLNTIIARFVLNSAQHMNLIFFIFNLLTSNSTQDNIITAELFCQMLKVFMDCCAKKF